LQKEEFRDIKLEQPTFSEVASRYFNILEGKEALAAKLAKVEYISLPFESKLAVLNHLIDDACELDLMADYLAECSDQVTNYKKTSRREGLEKKKQEKEQLAADLAAIFETPPEMGNPAADVPMPQAPAGTSGPEMGDQDTWSVGSPSPEADIPGIKKTSRQLMMEHQERLNELTSRAHKEEVQRQERELDEKELNMQLEEAFGVRPLGRDRHGRVYWWLPSLGGLMVERAPESVTLPLKEGTHVPGPGEEDLAFVTSGKDFDDLTENLEFKNSQERSLKAALKQKQGEILSRLPLFARWVDTRERALDVEDEGRKALREAVEEKWTNILRTKIQHELLNLQAVFSTQRVLCEPLGSIRRTGADSWAKEWRQGLHRAETVAELCESLGALYRRINPNCLFTKAKSQRNVLSWIDGMEELKTYSSLMTHIQVLARNVTPLGKSNNLAWDVTQTLPHAVMAVTVPLVADESDEDEDEDYDSQEEEEEEEEGEEEEEEDTGKSKFRGKGKKTPSHSSEKKRGARSSSRIAQHSNAGKRKASSESLSRRRLRSRKTVASDDEDESSDSGQSGESEQETDGDENEDDIAGGSPRTQRHQRRDEIKAIEKAKAKSLREKEQQERERQKEREKAKGKGKTKEVPKAGRNAPSRKPGNRRRIDDSDDGDQGDWDMEDNNVIVVQVNSHELTCSTCQRKGDLIFCSICGSGIHLRCHQPPLKTRPRGKWICSECEELSSGSDEDTVELSSPRKSGRATRGRNDDLLK